MTNHSQLFPNKKERTDFWIAISVILVFLASIVFYLFGGSDKIETTSIASSLEQTEETNAGFMYTEKEETTGIEKPETNFEEGQMDEVVTPVESEEIKVETRESISTMKEEVLPIEKETTEELPEYIDEEVEEIEEEMPNKKAEPEESIISKVPPIKEELKKHIPSETERIEAINPKNRNLKLESTAEDTPYGCIVIVGSFKEPANSKTLIKKLKAQNYPVYEGAYKGYYIVGVNSDCAKEKINPLLKKMRVEYEKTAWVYRR